ncbi:MAG TPA: 2-oxoglutarate dehydrogenase complex dihydrolipoyllysine-residue succinyltransferase [Gemmataceae bacterium]|jgi:2-oxoglutarate dehydrogenase E2 component (dihydrolipoamide succinyltransferase)
MSVEIKVPSVGESITEGTIARWLKKDGDLVAVNDPLFELETEKATTEVPATVAGKLSIQVTEGQTVAIGSVIGRIEPGAAATPRSATDGAKEKTAVAPSVARQTNHAEASPAPAPIALSPAARQLAADQNVDLSQVAGTGRGGRVMKEDVLKHLRHHPAQLEFPEPAKSQAEVAKPPAEPAKPGEARETRQRMSSIRQRVAERLVVAQHSAALLTTFNEADLSGVMALRSKYKEPFQKKHGIGLGLMSFFVKACVEALKAFPLVNARIDGSDIVSYHYYDIGVAVSTEKGLMVPVVRNADQLSFAEIEQRIVELADKARAGKISVQDLQGGTFTITNGGVFGSLLSTPLINPPQSAILGMHTIQKRPVVVNDQIVIRPMMYLALSYDHRLIDGRDAVGFLVRVKECIETPDRLLLEV